jgi:RNA polymerase sigma factor (sigma-70 family)
VGPTGEDVTKPVEAQPDQAKAELFEAPRPPADPAARKRAAVEMIARHGRALRNTARRYSLCPDDADDAYQRTLEIVLTKAPTDNQRELIRWTHTVMKHEALAVRRNRERLLGTAPAPSGEDEGVDWVTLIPAPEDGPELRVERREQIARSREALQALKPAELQTLTLLGEGYSYAEISEMTGFSRTKVNRCLAEGRERFRLLVSRTEDGSRCEEMRPLLSAFCDGEAASKDAATVREHLRACAPCRAAMRNYRATPGTVAALTPFVSLSHSLLDRLREALSRLHSHLPGRGAGGHAAAPLGSGGGAGAALAGVAKVAVVFVGAAGGAAVGIATGAVPSPFEDAGDQLKAPVIERVAPRVEKEALGKKKRPQPKPRHRAMQRKKPGGQGAPALAQPIEETTAPVEEVPVETAEAPVEYSAPPAASASVPSSESSSPSSAGAAGEFSP